jgi:hypothetical protein
VPEDSAKNPCKVGICHIGCGVWGDDDLSVDSEAESGEEEKEGGGEAGDISICNYEEVAGIALLAALRGVLGGGAPVLVDTALNVIGLDIRSADKAVVPLLPPFIL